MILRNLFSAKQVGVLYHYTSILACREILRTNFLKGFVLDNPQHLSIFESGIDLPGNIRGVVSFTRNKNFHRVIRALVHTQARFMVDGDKLSNNYKIIPFDYFSDAASSLWDVHTADRPQYQKNVEHFLIETDISDEAEEVLLLRKGQTGITGIQDYVLNVGIHGRNKSQAMIDNFEKMVHEWAPDLPVGVYL